VLIDSITTQFLWHGGMIDAEIEGGQVTKRYISINLRPVAVVEYENDTNSDEIRYSSDSYSGSKYDCYSPILAPRSTSIYAIHTDHLGTPQAISDSQQAVVWRANYATFGKATVQARVVDGSSKTAKTSFGIISTANAATATAKPFEFNLRFAGQYEDVESGYHYNWHRYYDPSTGRYLTPDPIGLAGGLNGYGYAGQDPMGAVDPWGLSSVSANGRTTFTTDLPDLPTFDIPTPLGWTDYNNSDLLGHSYNKDVTANNLTAAEINALRDYMIAHPTPSSLSKPATENGTYNPATPNCGPFSGRLANLVSPDDVYSYTRTGKSGRKYVINVTAANHSLSSGIVIRGVSSNGSGGAIFDNYGEGGGFNQSDGNPLSNTLINNVWYRATETALENVTGRPYTVKGRDWTESGNTANKKCGC
jgi:RHS repeat-associated protein